MQRFYIKIQNVNAIEAEVKFNAAEELVGVDLKIPDERELSETQREWLWNFLPKRQSEIYIVMKHPKCTVQPIEEDLSFESFWERYDLKVGKKDRAKKLWAQLSDLDKHKALKVIPKYNNWLIEKNINKVYPETYLAQRRFENAF